MINRIANQISRTAVAAAAAATAAASTAAATASSVAAAGICTGGALPAGLYGTFHRVAAGASMHTRRQYSSSAATSTSSGGGLWNKVIELLQGEKRSLKLKFALANEKEITIAQLDGALLGNADNTGQIVWASAGPMVSPPVPWPFLYLYLNFVIFYGEIVKFMFRFSRTLQLISVW